MESPPKKHLNINNLGISELLVPIEIIANGNLEPEHGLVFALIDIFCGPAGCPLSKHFLNVVSLTVRRTEEEILRYISDLKQQGFLKNISGTTLGINEEYETLHADRVEALHERLEPFKNEF